MENVETGVFPPEAFRVSAPTSYDMANRTFACHMSGLASVTCAGFMLRHDENNMSVRLSRMLGTMSPEPLRNPGVPVYRSYREMAIANGVDPEDPVLKEVLANGDPGSRCIEVEIDYRKAKEKVLT